MLLNGRVEKRSDMSETLQSLLQKPMLRRLGRGSRLYCEHHTLEVSALKVNERNVQLITSAICIHGILNTFRSKNLINWPSVRSMPIPTFCWRRSDYEKNFSVCSSPIATKDGPSPVTYIVRLDLNL